MPALSKIEWTDATWNPVRGCTRVSEACRNCYAEIMAARFSDPGQWGEGFASIVRLARGELDHRWTGKVALVDDVLDWPLRWCGSKQARAEGRCSRIFVNSTSDLFHEALPDEAIDRVFAVMALSPQHTFQALTKRPERMRRYVSEKATPERVGVQMLEIGGPERKGWYTAASDGKRGWVEVCIPLPNLWLGVSVEDQASADERIPQLLQTPAAKHFISAEPLLGPVDLTCVGNARPYRDALTGDFLHSRAVAISRSAGYRLSWVITGGESGHDARAGYVTNAPPPACRSSSSSGAGGCLISF